MRHATESDLASLAQLLSELDNLALEWPALKLRKKGVYYLKSKAFLHFHEDEGALLADVKLDGITFESFNVSTRKGQSKLLRDIKGLLTA